MVLSRICVLAIASVLACGLVGCGGDTTPSPISIIELDVRVVVLYNENGEPDSEAPWWDNLSGTMPVDSEGNVTQEGSLAADLTKEDITEIFDAVKEIYAEANIKVNVVGPFFTKPTVPCNGVDAVCGKHKCRTSGYFTRYWGTMNRRISKCCREERATNVFSMFPRELFVPGEYHMVYMKFQGWTSQGVVLGTTGADWLRPPDAPAPLSVATAAQWSNKFSELPERRPNVVPCDGQRNCGFGLHYTTAHEIGHLLNLGHTDRPSIMTGGGADAASSRFSAKHIETMRAAAGTPKLIPSYAEVLGGTPDKSQPWRENVACPSAEAWVA